MNPAGSDHAVFLERCRSARMPAALDGDQVDRSLDQSSGGPGPDAVDHRAGSRHVIRARTDPPNAAGEVDCSRRPRCWTWSSCVAGLGPGAGAVIPDHYATGLLLVGVASAGPLGIKAAQLARADLPYAIALVVVLEAANVVAIPVWVALLLPPGVQVPMWPVVRTLLLLVLAPLAVGMAVRAPATSSGAPGAVGGAAVDGRAAGGDRHRAGKVCAHRPGRRRGGGPGSVDGRAAGAAAGLLGRPGRPTRAATSLVTGCGPTDWRWRSRRRRSHRLPR